MTEEWREYFMGLLGSTDGRVRKGVWEEREEGEAEDVGMEEVEEAIRSLDANKAAGGGWN